jgi:hypothetical protein
LFGWNIDEFSILIDKPFNQPGASNPVDLWAFARNPFHNKITFDRKVGTNCKNDLILPSPGFIKLIGVERNRYPTLVAVANRSRRKKRAVIF